jgi:hypothetical protein
MAYAFDQVNALIEVTAPQNAVDVQDLINAIRDEEASERGITYDSIAKASGKESLGEGIKIGLTVQLLGNWQCHFWPGAYIAKIAGGNLVGGPGGDPVAYSEGVQVLLIQSAASTVVETTGGTGGSGSGLTQEERDRLFSTALQTTAQAAYNKANENAATLAAIKAKTDALPANPASREDVEGVNDKVTQALGLLYQNSVLDQQEYVDQKLIWARLRCYDSAANAEAAGTTGLLRTYAVTANYDGVGLATLFRITQVA